MTQSCSAFVTRVYDVATLRASGRGGPPAACENLHNYLATLRYQPPRFLTVLYKAQRQVYGSVDSVEFQRFRAGHESDEGMYIFTHAKVSNLGTKLAWSLPPWSIARHERKGPRHELWPPRTERARA